MLNDKEILEIINAVASINYDLSSDYQEIIPPIPPVDYSTTGVESAVSWMGQTIWFDGEDEREFIEEKNDYEPIEPFLRKKITELIGTISNLGKL